MRLGVPKETLSGERRVALVPESVAGLTKTGLQVAIEAGAGHEACFPDRAYEQAGAQIMKDPASLWGQADILLKVQRPAAQPGSGRHEADLLKDEAVLVCFLYPEGDQDLLGKLRAKRITSFAMERIPRISRAQYMDALSSQSTIAGYLAVIRAAEALPKFFPLLMTAAGTMAPARVFVLGAGVAGLQAIATARRLGARVEAFDVRPTVKEQVESLGASFVGLELQEATGAGGYAKALSEEAHQREQALIREHIQQADVVITTALIPGKPAPRLITADMVQGMKPGAVIVDLASEQGGNCELTQPGTRVQHNGITVLGPLNLPSAMPLHASQMYARNLTSFVTTLVKDGALHLDFNDEVIQATCVTHRGATPPDATAKAST